jgi:uncharacterized membrane protein YccF (DUF307 family)
MSFLGNIIWFIFGGWYTALSWFVIGLLWCITIIGMPYGLQCFKFAKLSACPFGKDVEYSSTTGSFILNIIWIIVTGVPMAIEHFATGVILCCTIIGIPFGLQHFKMAKLAFAPFGTSVA